ncbi:hypothetical protein Ga0061061_101367 [Chelatococcus sambhunathii]|uniref:Uncharacterized protein n=1 Tax=Chelatococcus sambhunathii TaxID=363953 RepID=A0ABP1ZYM6_9HYPH|nr:hypothetical protein Ga0061061_101367 [Chelatococcus sambhunathii]
MLLTFILARLSRLHGYAWQPAVELDDPQLISTLIPDAQH